MSSLALGAIGVYRQYLSPLKGYRCAHNAVHHRGSCSDFALVAYRRFGFRKATALMLERLRDCRRAYLIYLAAAGSESDGEDGADRRKSKSPELCHPLDALYCVNSPGLPDATCSSISVCDCLGGLSL